MIDNEPKNKPSELTDEFVTPLNSKLLLLKKQVQNFGEQDMEATRMQAANMITIQALCITMKVDRLCERWQKYLPLKEDIDVNFGEWAQEVERWKESISQPLLSRFNDKEAMRYWLDLYGVMCEGDPFWQDTDPRQSLVRNVEDFCMRVDQILRNMFKTREQWVPQVEHLVLSQLGLHYDGPCDVSACLQTLDNLKLSLEHAHMQFNSQLDGTSFQRLSIRLRLHLCKDTLVRAKAETTEWDNAWPGKSRKDKAIAKKKELTDVLNSQWWSSLLSDYMDFDFPNPYEDSDFGRFLYYNRRSLSIDDVQLIMKSVYQISWCNEKIGLIPPKPILRILTESEQHIADELMMRIEIGNWKSEYTVNHMKAGMRLALGIGQPLDENDARMSEELWNMLKKRKNCDDEKSIKVTFLNFVGWCMREGVDIISGGSPAVCKAFYGKPNDEDYRAIDKGRACKVAKFEFVTPLLLRAFKGVTRVTPVTPMENK